MRTVPRKVHVHDLWPSTVPLRWVSSTNSLGERINKRGNPAITVCCIAALPVTFLLELLLQLQTDYLCLTSSKEGKSSLTMCTESFYCPAVRSNFWVVLFLQMAEEDLRRVLFLLGLQMLNQFYISEHGEGSFNRDPLLVWTNTIRRIKKIRPNWDWPTSYWQWLNVSQQKSLI